MQDAKLNRISISTKPDCVVLDEEDRSEDDIDDDEDIEDEDEDEVEVDPDDEGGGAGDRQSNLASFHPDRGRHSRGHAGSGPGGGRYYQGDTNLAKGKLHNPDINLPQEGGKNKIGTTSERRERNFEL